MDKNFSPAIIEEKIYRFWEVGGFFEAKVNKSKKPFSIILPPANANADLHLGHAMYTYEDIMIRYQKLRGYEILWLPGADHAGIETQYVFEKYLQKRGKSRLDYDRDTLFKMIWDFVIKNKNMMENQLKRLGFALDWTKKKFTLDSDIVKVVKETFKKLFDSGLLYRAKRLVNYCTFCGTSFSDLEVVYKERQDPLYFIKYGPFVLATTRPETKFGDTAIAVNPDDKRYQARIGREIEVEGLLGKFKIKVIADEAVEVGFGTGVVKVTPAHDFTDFEVGQRHNLEIKQVIGYDGKLNELTGPYKGLYINAARKKIVADLQKKGLIEKINKDYIHRVGTCYKCARIIEPLPKEQWFIKIRPLADKAKELVSKNNIKIYPKRFKKILTDWFNNFADWNISRQIVWGIRIPAYKCKKSKIQNPNSQNSQWFVSVDKPDKCHICGDCDFEQDSDTFDTWFSSSQWPFATLQTINIKGFFEYFYPTSVMETGYEILPWWVARMIMIGYFVTDKIPFQNVFLHGMVRDKSGKKMSKSKGNVINPIEMVDKYGADALRAALIFELKEGSDVVVFEEKIKGMRNFANKVWNIGRFIYINRQISNINPPTGGQKNKIVDKLKKEFITVQSKYIKYMDSYQFSKALGLIYEFIWHRLADYFVEALKKDIISGNIKAFEGLRDTYLKSLKLLHPFMPFVSEAVWQVFKGSSDSILSSYI